MRHHNTTTTGIEDFANHKNNIYWCEYHDQIVKNPNKFIDKIRYKLEPEFRFSDIYDSFIGYYNRFQKIGCCHLRGLTNEEREHFHNLVNCNSELIFAFCKYNQTIDIERKYLSLPIDFNFDNDSESIRNVALSLPEILPSNYSKNIVEKILSFYFDEDEILSKLSQTNTLNLEYNKFSKLLEVQK